MIYSYPYLSVLGILGFFFWLLFVFLKIKVPRVIYIPATYLKKVSILPRLLVFLLGAGAWFYLTLALMQPRTPISSAKTNIKVNDIFFVVDVSKSMEAVDFKPNRLTAAKKKIYDFISLRPTDRMGIIMFSEKPFTLLPLTLDHELVKQSVDDIIIGPLGAGTNIGDALSLAVARASFSETLNKVIVLLTDGVSMMGRLTPTQAAETAAEKGIKIYSIGIGKVDSKHVLKNNLGRYQKLPGGSVDLKALEKIAEITGGKSFYAGSEKALEEVFEEIQKMEKIEIKGSTKTLYEEHYLKYLLIGLLLLTIGELFRKYLMREPL